MTRTTGAPTNPTLEVIAVGFARRHVVHAFPKCAGTHCPDGADFTWSKKQNPDTPVAYTRGAMVELFASLRATREATNKVDLRVKTEDGAVIAGKREVSLGPGTHTIVTGVTATVALESRFTRTTPRLLWEAKFDSGGRWTPIGTSGPHTIYWTWADPRPVPFAHFFGLDARPKLYDLALEKAVQYADKRTDEAAILSALCVGIHKAITYDSKLSLPYTLHPLDAYQAPGGVGCADLGHLLSGLAKSIGIDAPFRYCFGGPDASTMEQYRVPLTGQTDVSLQLFRPAQPPEPANPHFQYHVVVVMDGVVYDPSYGIQEEERYFKFAETARSGSEAAARQQSAEYYPEKKKPSKWSCKH